MDERERRNPDIFNEQLSDQLLGIYNELKRVAFIPTSLTRERTDKICDKLQQLAEWAREIGDGAKEEVLEKLDVRFDSLHTIGIVDKIERFQSEATHALDLLETVLLIMDGTVKKNKGTVLNSIRAEREADRSM